MEPVDRHPLEADVSFDGGDLDCGNGLLLLIRQHIDPLERGQLLEFRSTEIFVEEDFPAWCRMTGNDLISLVRRGKERSFLVCKGKLGERRSPTRRARMATLARRLPPRPNASTILLWRRNLAEGSCRWPRRLRRTRCSPSSTAWCVRPWPTSRAPGG